MEKTHCNGAMHYLIMGPYNTWRDLDTPSSITNEKTRFENQTENTWYVKMEGSWSSGQFNRWKQGSYSLNNIKCFNVSCFFYLHIA